MRGGLEDAAKQHGCQPEEIDPEPSFEKPWYGEPLGEARIVPPVHEMFAWDRVDGRVGFHCDSRIQGERYRQCINVLEGMVPGELAGFVEAAECVNLNAWAIARCFKEGRKIDNDLLIGLCAATEYFDAALARLREEKDGKD